MAGRQESGGLLPAHCTSPTLSPARDFFFLLLPPYLWSRAALLIEDGEIKTEQVHVEVEINCGEKKKYAQVSKQRMRSVENLYSPPLICT